MKVTPKTLNFPLAMTDVNRGKGLHASDIYGSYYETANPKKYGKRKDQPPPDLLFAVGLAWEQYLEKVLVANGVLCERPGELIGEWEGKEIKFSPDLLIVNGEDKLGEIKATWMSSRVGPTHKDFGKYLTQGKMYAYFTGIHTVLYYVLHVVGNWRDYPFPILKLWEISFTKRELLDEMKTMMNHARDERLFETIGTVARTQRPSRNKR